MTPGEADTLLERLERDCAARGDGQRASEFGFARYLLAELYDSLSARGLGELITVTVSIELRHQEVK